MSKSLHTIQTLAKLAKVFSQIIFICCLVGSIGSLVGIAVLLGAGTPFTMEGSREILRLGILTIAIPMGVLILEGIAYGIFEVFYPMTEQIHMEDMGSVGMGVMFLLASVILRYGTEVLEQKKDEEVS